jgi:hypothetical protein
MMCGRAKRLRQYRKVRDYVHKQLGRIQTRQKHEVLMILELRSVCAVFDHINKDVSMRVFNLMGRVFREG